MIKHHMDIIFLYSPLASIIMGVVFYSILLINKKFMDNQNNTINLDALKQDFQEYIAVKKQQQNETEYQKYQRFINSLPYKDD